MTWLNFREEVIKWLRKWLVNAGVDVNVEATLARPPRKDLGDLSTSLPLRLCKRLKKGAYELATEIALKFRPSGLIKDVRPSRPGYVNFYCDFSALARNTVEQILSKGENFAKVEIGGGRKVLVEYTSVNPNKALHVGHARNVCLGVALSNLLESVGYRVERVNYINDAGAQMADIMLGFLVLGYPGDKPGVKFDHYCGDEVYTVASRKAEEDPQLLEKRREIAREIERIGSEISRKTREIAERVLREQLKTCWRLGAEYDVLVWETDILGVKLWDRAFEVLKMSDLIQHEVDGVNKGCWVVKLTKTEKYTRETDKVLVRSDGTKTYVAKDLSLAMWKLGLIPSPFKFKLFAIQANSRELWSSTLEDGVEKDFGSADLAINVIDVRQSRLQDTIKIVLSGIYGEEYGRRYIHYAYEVVSLSKQTAEKYLGVLTEKRFIHMSGRKGLYINVDDILDFLKSRAKEESLKRNPGLSPEDIDEISERVAVASLKYPMLATDREKIVVFDVDKALDVTEESGSYILYGYARASRILEKASNEVDGLEVDDLRPDNFDDVEREVISRVAELPLLVKISAESLEVKGLAKYVYELTLTFNKFYERCPVLVDDEELRRSRLLIVLSYVTAMRTACKILGIPLVERM